VCVHSEAVILDLREFKSFPARAQVTADPEKFSVDYDSIHSLERLTVDLEVQQAGDEYYCRGTVVAEANVECARCLAIFPTELTGEIDFFCRPEGWKPPGDDGVVDDEDYAHFVGGDLRADIGELVRQAVVLAVDLKPVCREDCRGLCPSCGCNLNESDCGCKSDVVDERWSALKDLKKKLT
ncbi:MAG: DUF177 domain-containing protein, partial [bacterium]